jgi:FKBP-type peptidyl-prolyl cis-trans isomerase (trigger factor)
MKVEDFLKSQKTTMDELKKGWRREAEDRVKAEVILMQVAKEYKITVEDKEVDKQINAIRDEKLRKQYESPQARNYIRSIILRQKVVKRIVEEVEGKG